MFLARTTTVLTCSSSKNVAKVYPGVYHINKEIFIAQIIVTKELSPENNLYLHFLTDRTWKGELAERLAEDYKEHQENNTRKQKETPESNICMV